MDNEMKSSLTAADTWTRGLFMLLFVVIYSVTEFVLGALVLFQFLHVLFTRETNERVLELTSDISVFIYQILQFLTFSSEVKPYPFADWPDGPADLESLDMLDNIQGGDDDTGAGSESSMTSVPGAAKPKAPADTVNNATDTSGKTEDTPPESGDKKPGA